MNELTGNPNLTNGVRQGKITSKPDGEADTSENKNEKILERTAHSAVLSASRGKLHAQAQGTDKGAIVDDVSVTKKTSTGDEKTVAAKLATNKDERSKQEQGSGGDSESFSGAQSTESLDARSQKDEENLKQLVAALKSLKKSDCIRILETPKSDPGHGISNLWNNDSTKRLNNASEALALFETSTRDKLGSLDSFEKFETFVSAEHSNKEDQALAATLYRISEEFTDPGSKVITGLGPKPQNDGLTNLFEFLNSEDHRQGKGQARLKRDINLIVVKELLHKDQKNEKLHYRLEATLKFSMIKITNPVEKLRQRVLEKFAGDKQIVEKAKVFRDTTNKNWTSLFDKLAHTVTEFSQILFTGLFSLLQDVNEKVGKDLAAKPEPVFVKSNQKSN